MAGFGAFAVPPGVDEEFLTAWREERAAGARLYRALRDDVPFRFVELAPAGADEVGHEDGEPEGDGGVLVITRLRVEDERRWHELRAAFAPLRGYLGARLLAGEELVAIVRWSSPLMYARALQRPEVQALQPAGEPVLYIAQ